jgi:flagellar protein FlbD
VILLTRLDNSRLLINLETVKYIESTPDTLITFLNGDSVIVREALETIEQRVMDYRVGALHKATEAAATPVPPVG